MASILGIRYANQPTGPTLGYVVAALRETHVVDVDSNGLQYHYVYWQESSMANALGEKHRVRSGWRGDLEGAPREIQQQASRGCPAFLLGVSIANLWRPLRYLLWCEVPIESEVDLLRMGSPCNPS